MRVRILRETFLLPFPSSIEYLLTNGPTSRYRFSNLNERRFLYTGTLLERATLNMYRAPRAIMTIEASKHRLQTMPLLSDPCYSLFPFPSPSSSIRTDFDLTWNWKNYQLLFFFEGNSKESNSLERAKNRFSSRKRGKRW